MKFPTKTAITLSFLFLSLNSYANYMFTPSITHIDRSLSDNSSPETNGKLSIIDLRLGYVFDMGLYVGGLYSLHDENMLSNSSDSFFGPSVGYYYAGWLLVGTYYLYGERDLTAGGIKYSKVEGHQIDLSYSIPLNGTIAIGPQITYHSVKFDEVQISGISQSTDYSYSGLTPYFNFTVQF